MTTRPNPSPDHGFHNRKPDLAWILSVPHSMAWPWCTSKQRNSKQRKFHHRCKKFYRVTNFRCIQLYLLWLLICEVLLHFFKRFLTLTFLDKTSTYISFLLYYHHRHIITLDWRLLLKLVLLEWSESKSDLKFGFSMLKNPPVQIFRAIGATSGIWQHFVIFAWWHVHGVSRDSTYNDIYYRHNFRKQFPVPK